MNLKDLEFTAEDFRETGTGGHSAEIANRLLKERLEKAPEVFAHKWVNKEVILAEGEFTGWGAEKDDTDTHRARLVCIEEIPK